MVLSKDLKIAIVVGLIFGAIISIFQVVGFCAESIVLTDYIASAGLSYTNGGSIVSSGGRVYYLEIEPGYKYSFHSTADQQRIGFGNTAEIGANVYDFQVLGSNDFTFYSADYKYVYFFVGTGYVGVEGTLEREQIQGLSGVVDRIAYALSIIDLAMILNNVVPILAISVLVGLGVYLVRRIINKIKKKKGGI